MTLQFKAPNASRHYTRSALQLRNLAMMLGICAATFLIRSGASSEIKGPRTGISTRAAAMLNRAVLVGFAFAFAGCASTQRTPLPLVVQDVPIAWSTPAVETPVSPPTSLSVWWMRFNDEVLTGLINEAMVANTSIQSAQASITQARALRDVTQAGLAPSLTGSASARRDTQGIAANNRSATTGYTTGINGSWTLDVYGGRQSALSASEAALWARTANLGDVQVQIAAELAATYIALRSSQERLSIAYQNLISQSNTLQIANWRRQAGLASTIETEQALTAVEQTRSSIPLLETAIDNRAHAISVLSGRPPGVLIVSLRTAHDVPSANSNLSIEIPAEALRQRADVRASEYAMLQAMGLLGQADAATKPSFVLGGSLSLSSQKPDTLLMGSSVLSSVFGTISLPIFDGGASKSQVKANEAALEISRLAYRATVLKALQDVEDALVVLRDDTQRLIALNEASQAAERAANLARMQYRAGLISFQIVLETQRIELATQDNLASAKASLSIDQINLYKSLGGGWVAPATLPLERFLKKSLHFLDRKDQPEKTLENRPDSIQSGQALSPHNGVDLP
jgi:outer membrane protein, multidrug efflux system